MRDSNSSRQTWPGTVRYRPLRNQSECLILFDGPMNYTSHMIIAFIARARG